MTEDKVPDQHLLFRPDTFFLKPWTARGLVRDRQGRTIDRFTGHGRGRTGSRSATSEMTFTFESGAVQHIEADILSDADGQYYSRDLRSGMEGRGGFFGDGFRWVYAATPIPGLKGLAARLLKARVTATFSLLSPSRAIGFTEVRVFGVLIRSMTTVFEHADSPEPLPPA